MIPHHVYYQLAILGLVWLCIMLHYALAKPRRGVTSATRRTGAPAVQAQTLQRAQTLCGSDATTSLRRV